MRILFIEQGITQILMLIRQIRSKTDLSKLTRITLKWWQQQAGISFLLLEFPSITIPYLKWNWFTAVRKFLQHITGTLTIPTIKESIPKLLRKNDTSIMDEIIQTTTNKTMLTKFNRVRIYLGVYSIAEITTAVGAEIDREAYTGNRNRLSNQ